MVSLTLQFFIPFALNFSTILSFSSQFHLFCNFSRILRLSWTEREVQKYSFKYGQTSGKIEQYRVDVKGKVVMSHVHFRLFCTFCNVYYIFLFVFLYNGGVIIAYVCDVSYFQTMRFKRIFVLLSFLSAVTDYFQDVKKLDSWFWDFNRPIISRKRKH